MKSLYKSFLFLTLILAFTNEIFYRYFDLISVGVNFKVMDVCLLFLFMFFTLHVPPKTQLTLFVNKAYRNILIIYVLYLFFEIIHGFLSVGSASIGISRYSVLDFLIIPPLVYYMDSKENIVRLFHFLLVISIIAIVIGVLANADNIPLLVRGEQKARFIDAATVFGYGTALTFGFTFLLIGDKTLRYFQDKKYVTISFLILFFIIVMQHRSVWVAVFGTLAGGFVLQNLTGTRHARAIIRSLYVVAALVILPILVDYIFFNSELIRNLFLRRLNFIFNLSRDRNAIWRLLAWVSSIRYTIQHNILVGQGFTKFVWYTSTGDPLDVWEHNQYVHLFRTCGAIGLTLFLTIIFRSLYLSFRGWLRRSDLGVLYMAAFLLILSNVFYMMFYNQTVYLSIALSVLIAIMRIESKNNIMLSAQQ
jgi:hypothetical protein